MRNWENAKGIYFIKFDDMFTGGCVVKVKKMREWQWVGQIAMAGQGRWDSDTRLGEWDTLGDAKANVLEVLKNQSWCPSCCK